MSKSLEYNSYHSARKRCLAGPTSPRYKDYGARGIKFLYTSFEQFIADVGLKPSTKHTLDRINNDGNYEPGNCRWATHKEQQDNRRVKRIDQFTTDQLLEELKRRGVTANGDT